MALVNKQRKTAVTKVLKATGARLCLNACGLENQQKLFVLTGVLQNAQPINSERIYAQTRHSSFPGLISVARVNESRTTDATRILKATGAELFQNACGVVSEQKIFCCHQCSPECSMNKLRVYISPDTCFVLRRTHQCGSS